MLLYATFMIFWKFLRLDRNFLISLYQGTSLCLGFLDFFRNVLCFSVFILRNLKNFRLDFKVNAFSMKLSFSFVLKHVDIRYNCNWSNCKAVQPHCFLQYISILGEMKRFVESNLYQKKWTYFSTYHWITHVQSVYRSFSVAIMGIH